jgi:hypothetical protein
VITALLSPYYMRHAFNGMTPTTVALLDGLGAHATVQALHHAVGVAIRKREPLGILAPSRAET